MSRAYERPIRLRHNSRLAAFKTEEALMRVLIVYGTTEGHTRELAGFMAHLLTQGGHEGQISDSNAPDQQLSPGDYDAVIIAASLHVGQYQATVVDFVRRHHEELNMMPSAFVSVSLSAAGVNPHDWEGLEQCIARVLTIDHDMEQVMEITGLSMAAHAARVTDPAEDQKVLDMLMAKYPPQHGSVPLPMPSPADVAIFKVMPTVISVLDYTKGFAHTDLVTC
jgi:menaquinone-dependent protoporphyrinogen IX oxidase